MKLKFQRLYRTLITHVDPGNIISSLYQDGVITLDETTALQRIREDPKQQCVELLLKLENKSKNQQAFVKLYAAIRGESELQWLVDSIDNVSRREIVHLVQQQYSNEPGE